MVLLLRVLSSSNIKSPTKAKESEERKTESMIRWKRNFTQRFNLQRPSAGELCVRCRMCNPPRLAHWLERGGRGGWLWAVFTNSDRVVFISFSMIRHTRKCNASVRECRYRIRPMLTWYSCGWEALFTVSSSQLIWYRPRVGPHMRVVNPTRCHNSTMFTILDSRSQNAHLEVYWISYRLRESHNRAKFHVNGIVKYTSFSLW